MEAIKFKGANVVFAEDQDEYKSLPAAYDKTRPEGVVVTCYKLSFTDKIRVLFGGKVWVAIMTFNKSLQPQYLSTKRSDVLMEVEHGGVEPV